MIVWQVQQVSRWQAGDVSTTPEVVTEDTTRTRKYRTLTRVHYCPRMGRLGADVAVLYFSTTKRYNSVGGIQPVEVKKFLIPISEFSSLGL